MRRIFPFACLALVALSYPTTRGARLDTPAQRAVDSVVLERTPCFGSCPAYRIRIGSSGEVTFVSRTPSLPVLTAVDTVVASAVDSLHSEALQSGFFSLPDTIQSSPYCAVLATDHPTITIGLFGARTKQVAYYTGCYAQSDTLAARLQGLQQLAARIDSITCADRWIRPTGRRRAGNRTDRCN